MIQGILDQKRSDTFYFILFGNNYVYAIRDNSILNFLCANMQIGIEKKTLKTKANNFHLPFSLLMPFEVQTTSQAGLHR